VEPGAAPALSGSAAAGGVVPVTYYTRVQEDPAPQDAPLANRTLAIASVQSAASVQPANGATDQFAAARGRRRLRLLRRRRQLFHRRARLLAT